MRLSKRRLAELLDIARGRGDGRCVLLEGPRAIQDALDAGCVVEVWASEALVPRIRGALLEAAAQAEVPVGQAGVKEITRISRTPSAQGVLAVARDVTRSLAMLPDRGWWLWLDAVQDPGNVGALLRSAAAFGAQAALLSAGSAHPLGAKALRASAGLALRLPFARCPVDEIAACVAARAGPTWGLVAGASSLYRRDPVPPRGVLVIGNEAHGLSQAATDVLDAAVALPMAGGVESLNAAVAGSVALSVILRGHTSETPARA